NATLVGGGTMGAYSPPSVSAFFNNCTTNVVNIVVGDRAPADVDVVVTAQTGTTQVMAHDVIHVDSGEVKTFYSRLGSGNMLPPCEGGVGGSSGAGGIGGSGGTGGSGGIGGTGGSGGGDLGAPCTSGAQCSPAFPTCLMSVLTQIPFPNGYST